MPKTLRFIFAVIAWTPFILLRFPLLLQSQLSSFWLASLSSSQERVDHLRKSYELSSVCLLLAYSPLQRASFASSRLQQFRAVMERLDAILSIETEQ